MIRDNEVSRRRSAPRAQGTRAVTGFGTQRNALTCDNAIYRSNAVRGSNLMASSSPLRCLQPDRGRSIQISGS